MKSRVSAAAPYRTQLFQTLVIIGRSNGALDLKEMAETEKAANTSNVNPKSYKCKDCKTSYPDVYSYAEHLESKEHIKGVMKKKYGEKYLEAKAKLDGETPSPKPTTPKEPEKEETTGSEDSDEDEVFPCEVCKKVCTGYLSYKLHLQGKKHNKNLLKQGLMNQMKEQQLLPLTEKKPKDELEKLLSQVQTGQTEIVCELCNKPCSGPEAYKQHLQSKAHLKKMLTNNMITEMDSLGLSQKSEIEGVHSYCESCKKGFSGPIPYLQHLKSPIHLKQAKQNEMRDQIKDLVTTSEEDTKIYCKECGKTFSGPIPFHTHLKSTVHEKLKKKNNLLADLEKHPELFKRSVDDEDSDSDITLGCQVCHMIFSGPEAAKDHFNSPKHKKAIKKKAMFKKYKTQVNVAQQGNDGVNQKNQLKITKTKSLKKEEPNSSSDEFEVIPNE